MSPRLHSLRTRAIIFSMMISLSIVVVSFVGYSNFKTFYVESSLHLQQRDELLVNLSLIRGELLATYQSLNHFLLTPENSIYQTNIFNSLAESLRISTELSKHPWVHKYNYEPDAATLTEKLKSLDTEIRKLIEIRLNITNQFPSLAVGAEIMQPNRNKLNNALALAMYEASVDNLQITKPQVFRTLINVRHLWGQVLSNFRLYLANRVGSFNKDSLPVQEKAIEVLFAELQNQFAELSQYSQKGEVGFETTEAIPLMIESSRNWFKGFEKVKVIHQSDEWRKDAKIMKVIIAPEIDLIVETLVSLESIIVEASESDMQSYASLGTFQNRMIWFVAILGIMFTLVVVLMLDKLVFKPIALVSKALKFEALGKQSEHIPLVKAKETQDLVEAFSEMSHQVHARQAELEYHALHDSLTTLPNRSLLLDRLGHDINNARREDYQLCVLILDLDDFKEVNDTLGHIAGDKLLIEVGARIIKVLRDVDTVARIGGDEFSILLSRTNEEQGIITAQKVLASLRDSFKIENIDVSISASIGIAIYPLHANDVNTLLRYADIAMYVAKRNKLGFEVYNEEIDKHSITRLSLTQDFREALENNKLTLNYQPIFNLANNKIVAVESLCRWHHHEHGYVPPENFIRLAEQTGLINTLTYWVLNESLRQLTEWHDIRSDLTGAVNLSVSSFKDPEFIGEVRSALKKYNYPAEKLILEITESAMMENPLHAIEILTELSLIGIKLSIDDYGTGFSSMTYLKQLPVTDLKIDKSFIIGLEQDNNNDAIVRSTIELAHNLGLQVIAEGIETQVVNDLVKKYNCDMAQGFYLSRPLPADQVVKLLKAK